MSDILIIGGGIIGLMSARELLLQGAQVCLLEKRETGQESSWAGGGILSPLYPWRVSEAITQLFLWSHHHYPELVSRIHHDTGIDPEWVRSGLLVADAVEEREGMEAWAEHHALAYSWLDRDEAMALEPAADWQDWNPLHLPAIAQVRNPRLLAAVRADVLRLGGAIIEQAAVTRIHTEGGRVAKLETRQRSYHADTYVIAAGAWSGELVLDTGDTGLQATNVDVQPVKGQMLIVKTRPGTVRHIILCNGKYLIPRQDGRVLVGSTLEYTGFEKETTATARNELLTFARRWLPGIPLEVEKHWAGLRPGSSEGIPYICQHPSLNNLYLNCGHFRNGFVMAPASARLLSDLITHRPGFTGLEAYSLSVSV